MSLIKLKVKSEKLKVKYGFTLIEMIITLSILGLIILIASGFLFSSINSSNKTEVSKEVRQNGAYALSVMEGLIHSSRSVYCIGSNTKSFSVEDNAGFWTTFECEEYGTDGDFRISSSSAALLGGSSVDNVKLTGENITVSNCEFVCSLPDPDHKGKPSKVNINFTVSQKAPAGVTLRPNEQSSINFQTEVVAKNAID